MEGGRILTVGICCSFNRPRCPGQQRPGCFGVSVTGALRPPVCLGGKSFALWRAFSRAAAAAGAGAAAAAAAASAGGGKGCSRSSTAESFAEFFPVIV